MTILPSVTGEYFFERIMKMVHMFKFGGQRIAYDSASGLVLPLSELAYKMLEYIELPMPAECSSALRYDLAKYDSAAIGETYEMLYGLYSEGRLFAEDGASVSEASGTGAAIRLGSRIYGCGDVNICELALALADAGEDTEVSVVPAPDGVSPYVDSDVPALIKELEHIAKAQVKRKRAGERMTFNAFPERTGCAHNDEICGGCWARKLCTLENPQSVMCELERKRAECVMVVNASEISE